MRAEHRLWNEGMTRLLVDLVAISVTFAGGDRATPAENARQFRV
jgi:hypothetical protein